MSQDSRHPYKADPYRAARKPSSPDGYYESPEAFHSRSPSESSTSRLAASTTNNEDYYYQQQDPYAPSRIADNNNKKRNNNKKKTPRQHQQQQQIPTTGDKRANSYLPYSNHKRDPYNPVEPIYLEDDDSPSNRNTMASSNNNHRGPVGSILQDNIVMDMIQDEELGSQYNKPNNNSRNNHDDLLATKEMMAATSPNKGRLWITKKLGISGRKLVFIVFGFIAIVVIIWYFMWPRTPTLSFLEAGLTSNANYSSTTMIANWNVNFTVNNQDNWIPTNINNFAVSVIDSSTGEIFGYGNSNHLSLKPRSIDQIITVPIYINFTRDPTNPTIIDLLNACSMINQDLSSPLPTQTLDISFSVVYYIAGIAWHAISTFSPTSYFQCPITIT